METEKETATLLCDILREDMNLKEEQVVIYNERWKIPTTSGLLISVALLATRPFGTSKRYEDGKSPESETGGLQQVQTVNQQESFTLNIYSQDGSARRRNHELILALASDRAQQSQEKYSYRIGVLPLSMVDVSTTEGAARLNRYAATFSVLRAYERRQLVESFNIFQIPPKKILVNP